MHALLDRAGTLGSLLYKAEKPSVCLCHAAQLCRHQLKQDLLQMNAVSLKKELIFKSRQRQWFFDKSMIKAKHSHHSKM